MPGFIAVHVGAGQHSSELWSEYKELCNKACKAALQLLQEGKDATEAVARAVETLENSRLTNAGKGSNLTLYGTVECDASIMEGSSLHFGSVGALQRLANPVQVAKKLLEQQKSGLSFGRIAPCTLVGKGAAVWARKQGFHGYAKLVSKSARASYVKYKNLLKKKKVERSSELRSRGAGESGSTAPDVDPGPAAAPSPVVVVDIASEEDDDDVYPPAAKRRRTSDARDASTGTLGTDCSENKDKDVEVLLNPSETNLQSDAGVQPDDPSPDLPTENILLDTVGAVCVDASGNVSSAVSSGGILLKHPGRIGQSAVYGAGCWAQNSPEAGKPNVGCTVTGVGEYLIKTLFARECYRALYERDGSIAALPDAMRERFTESPLLESATQKRVAGVLAVKYYAEEGGGRCQVSWAHNSKTMILGYAGTGMKRTCYVVSSLRPGVGEGGAATGGEDCVRLI